jgi:hypothetical protein
MKYHPMTQKAINHIARRFLRLYRTAREGGASPDMARFTSRFVLEIESNGSKAEQIARARIWKVEQIRKAQ